METDEQQLNIPTITVPLPAVIIVGVWMFNVNRKLRVIKRSQLELAQGMIQTSYNIGLLHAKLPA